MQLSALLQTMTVDQAHFTLKGTYSTLQGARKFLAGLPPFLWSPAQQERRAKRYGVAISDLNEVCAVARAGVLLVARCRIDGGTHQLELRLRQTFELPPAEAMTLLECYRSAFVDELDAAICFARTDEEWHKLH